MPPAIPNIETAAPAGSSALLRALGPATAVAIVVGNVIGSGIFLKPGRIAQDGQDFGLIIAAWVAGGFLCLLGALSLAELCSMLPRAGGLYVYLREAYGRPVAFLFGWNDFLLAKPASIGALAVAFTGSLAEASGWGLGTAGEVTSALVLIVALAWLNCLGVVWGGRVQTATTLIKAGGVALIAISPWLVELTTGQGVEMANYTSLAADAPAPLATRLGLIMLAIMWAYNGWEGIAPVAEEIRDPERSIPRALWVGLAILIALYVSANVGYHGALSMNQMASAGDHAAEAVARKLAGSGGATAIAAIIMVSTFGAINSNMLLGPRVPFAMGRDGVFFSQLGRVHANYRTPAVAIVTQAAMAAALVGASAIFKQQAASIDVTQIESATLRKIVSTAANDSIFTVLTNFVIFGSSIFYFLAVLAVLVLRRKHPEWPRPYRTWGYPVVPLAYLAAYTWFLGQVYVDKPFEAHAGLVLTLAGLPAYWWWRTRIRA